MLRILTDTGADLTASTAQQWQVECISLPIEFSDGPYIQREEPDFDRFYEKLATSTELPHTSRPVFGDLLQTFEAIGQAGDEAIVLLLSSKISGTYESACKALDLSGAKGIYIVDSRAGTLVQHLLVERLVQWRDEGCTAEVLCARLQDAIRCVQGMALVDTLQYLRKGGRIPGALATIGEMIRIKPIIYFAPDGTLELLKKTRGHKAGLSKMYDLFQEWDLEEQGIIQIAYSGQETRIIAASFAETLQELRPQAQFRISPIGGVVGTHIGPGALAVSGFSKKPWR